MEAEKTTSIVSPSLTCFAKMVIKGQFTKTADEIREVSMICDVPREKYTEIFTELAIKNAIAYIITIEVITSQYGTVEDFIADIDIDECKEFINRLLDEEL